MQETLIALNPEKWVDNYADSMYKYLLFRVKQSEIAEDIVQETFVAALGSMNNYSGKANEKTWLFSIMKFKLADYYRKIYKTAPAEDIDDQRFAEYYFDNTEKEHWQSNAEPTLWHNELEKGIENTELQNILTDCLEKVPDKSASVFSMKYLEDYESKEICKALNISENNLWTLMHRAKLMLRDCIDKNWVTA